LKTKPYYWGFIGLIVIFFVNSSLILLFYFNNNDAEFVISRDTYVLSGLLLAEIFLYWFMRHDIYNKWWVKSHVIFFALGFIVFPFFIHFIGNLTLPIDATDKEYMERIILIAKIDVVVIYSSLIIAHIFFALTLLKSFKFKKAVNNNDEAPGLLDEFIN
jgi:hypothetical protein